jgi:hypothetical protein
MGYALLVYANEIVRLPVETWKVSPLKISLALLKIPKYIISLGDLLSSMMAMQVTVDPSPLVLS